MNFLQFFENKRSIKKKDFFFQKIFGKIAEKMKTLQILKIDFFLNLFLFFFLQKKVQKKDKGCSLNFFEQIKKTLKILFKRVFLK
jgi:hypothetical protein